MVNLILVSSTESWPEVPSFWCRHLVCTI